MFLKLSEVRLCPSLKQFVVVMVFDAKLVVVWFGVTMSETFIGSAKLVFGLSFGFTLEPLLTIFCTAHLILLQWFLLFFSEM